MFFGDDLKTMRSRHVAEGISILGANITMVQLGILGATSVAFFALWLVLYRTSLGLQVRAVANDAELARIAGTSPDKTITWVFAIGSALAAGAAILISFDTDLTPNMGFQALLMGMIAAIVGGIGSLWGTVLGAFFLGLVRQLAVWKLPGQWQDAIVFLVLITFLLFRPNGFLGGGRRPRSF
jgi:branched-subunit amino acid ABC-type transport system permease component